MREISTLLGHSSVIDSAKSQRYEGSEVPEGSNTESIITNLVCLNPKYTKVVPCDRGPQTLTERHFSLSTMYDSVLNEPINTPLFLQATQLQAALTVPSP
jgi:hypothetical protein